MNRDAGHTEPRVKQPYRERQLAAIAARWDERAPDWDRALADPACHLNADDAYARFLPHIRNNYDFAEMLGEMLGELNGSHTGCRYAPPQENTDQTASLGLFFDPKPAAKGLRIAEVLASGPLTLGAAKAKPGQLLLAIDGQELRADEDYTPLLNRKAGHFVLVKLQDPKSGDT